LFSKISDVKTDSDHWSNVTSIVETREEIVEYRDQLEKLKEEKARVPISGEEGLLMDFAKDSIVVNKESFSLQHVMDHCHSFDNHIRSLKFTACSATMFSLEEISAGGKFKTLNECLLWFEANESLV
jgi:hypothetical protein